MKYAGAIKKLIIFFLMLLYYTLTFRVFAYVPVGLLEDISTIVFIIVLLFFYIIDFYSSLKSGKIHLLQLVLIPIILIPFVNSVQAMHVYKQPLLYGILAQRTNFLVLVATFTVLLLKHKVLDIRQLEKYFVISAHLLLLLFFYYNLFVDPLPYVETDLVSFSMTRGYRFKFPNTIINALILYGIFQLWINKDRRYYVSLLLLFIYTVFFVQDRSQLVALLITITGFYILNFSVKRKIFLALKGLLLVLFLLLLFDYFFPDVLNTYIQLYTNSSAIFTGNSLTDASTRVRISEARIAIDGFLEHPWLGTGFISAQWNSGYKGLFDYFYPTDVGILGNLFVYGIAGTLAVYLLFALAAWNSLYLRKNFDVFLVTCQYTLVYLFFDMITVASNIKFIGMIAFFVAVVYYYRHYHSGNDEAPDGL